MIANDLLDFGDKSRKRSPHAIGESIAMSEILPCNGENEGFRLGLIESAGEMQQLLWSIYVRKLPGRKRFKVWIGHVSNPNVTRLIFPIIFQASRIEEDHQVALPHGVGDFRS